jgi:hypothetical protein
LLSVEVFHLWGGLFLRRYKGKEKMEMRVVYCAGRTRNGWFTARGAPVTGDLLRGAGGEEKEKGSKKRREEK